MTTDDNPYDQLDALVQRALDGREVGAELRGLAPELRREFEEMLQIRGGRLAELDLGEEAPATEADRASARAVAAFLDEYWQDRAQGRARSLQDYLSRHPGDAEAVARCYLALESSSGDQGGGDLERGQVGVYRIEDTLGRGGQATVYRAVDSKLGRSVALKVFHLNGAIDERSLARFKREARAVSKLSHPGIGQVFEAGVENGLPFIAMEFIPGMSLARLIQDERGAEASPPGRGDRKGLDRKLEIVEKIALALEAAHAGGVIHRDLKPANVMLREGGSPVLLDFGLAKIEDDEGPTLTATLDVLGTPAYIAPERLQQPDLQASRLEDVYALGVTAYELISGRRPFEAPTMEELFRSALRGDAPPLDRVAPLASRDLAVVVATAMEIDPARRYQSAAHLAEDVARLRRGESVSVRPVGTTTRALRWYRRNAVVATLALLVLATLTAFSISTWFNNRKVEGLRVEAVERGDKLARTLDEVLVLSDVKRVDDLIAEADTLWPVAPDLVPRIEDWLRRAKDLAARHERHRTSLAALLEKKKPLEDEEIAAALPTVWSSLQAMRAQLDHYREGRSGLTAAQEAKALATSLELMKPQLEAYDGLIAALADTRYPEAADAWRAELLDHLVRQLELLIGDENGLIAAIEGRLEISSSIAERTLVEHAAAWRRATREVAEDPRFSGFDLRPVPGLVPLGADPDSKLQEFLQLVSHEENEIPRRDESGRLPPMTAECGMIFVLVPGGPFVMGSVTEPGAAGFDPMAAPIETPRHEVTLAPYLIAKYEAWQGMWGRLAGSNPSTHRPGQTVRGVETFTELNPVESITWYDAIEVLARYGLTLPTEAQWERAARGGTTTRWSFGDDPKLAAGKINIVDRCLQELASNAGASGIGEHDDGHALHAPVDSYGPNPYGLYNVHGNVYEWCLDRFADYERPWREGDGLRLDRINASDVRIFRGGAYGYDVSASRSAMRVGTEATAPDSVIGFRPVLNLVPWGPRR